MISKEIDDQIKFFYSKSYNEMTEIEKQSIVDITINHKKFNGKNTDSNISEVLEFPCLEKCTISGFNITEEDIKVLNKCKTLKEIQFSNCNFININLLLKNIETLIIDNCKGSLGSIFERLEELTFLQVVGHEIFDIKHIEKCKKLRKIYIQDTVIKRIELLKNFAELELVNLNKSKFNQIAFALLKKNSEFEIVYDKNAQIKIG